MSTRTEAKAAILPSPATAVATTYVAAFASPVTTAGLPASAASAAALSAAKDAKDAKDTRLS